MTSRPSEILGIDEKAVAETFAEGYRNDWLVSFRKARALLGTLPTPTVTSVARDVKVGKTTVRHWKNGTRPPVEKAVSNLTAAGLLPMGLRNPYLFLFQLIKESTYWNGSLDVSGKKKQPDANITVHEGYPADFFMTTSALHGLGRSCTPQKEEVAMDAGLARMILAAWFDEVEKGGYEAQPRKKGVILPKDTLKTVDYLKGVKFQPDKEFNALLRVARMLIAYLFHDRLRSYRATPTIKLNAFLNPGHAIEQSEVVREAIGGVFGIGSTPSDKPIQNQLDESEPTYYTQLYFPGDDGEKAMRIQGGFPAQVVVIIQRTQRLWLELKKGRVTNEEIDQAVADIGDFEYL
jgi:hypothetical protein